MEDFSKGYEECSKCGSPTFQRRETKDGNQNIFSICKKCGHRVLLNTINVIKIK
jgi:DNA-directed RNA polymerase subunit RPC12/RpoP